MNRNARCITTLVIAAGLALCGAVRAQVASDPGARIFAKLQQAQLIDPYYPDIALEVAETLVRAAPGSWRGVQVNGAYRAGWLNVYVVDAAQLRSDTLLEEEGIDFTPEALAGGALAHEDTGTVFLNTAAWKRLAAATVMKQTGLQSDITAGLAAVDAGGLQAMRSYWDRSTLDAATPEMQRVGWLLRGALAFVLAHEMGHLQIGRSAGAEAAQTRLRDLANLTERQMDERLACPETLHSEFQQQQRHEQAADLAAVRLLGQQCRLGQDAELRHNIYLIGTSWYLLAAMGDKLLQMGRSSNSPLIAQELRRLIGPQLYQQAVGDGANQVRKGGVEAAFPKTHPPDYARIQAIERALSDTPCGGAGMDMSGVQVMEFFRERMCRNLAAPQGPR